MRKCLLVLAVVVLGMTGCQKLRFEQTVEVRQMSTHRLDFDPPAYKQEVRADIQPEDVSVRAYLVKTSDADAIETALSRNKEPAASLLLGGKTFKPNDSRQDFTLEATIPAKTPYSLIFNGGKKSTKVKVKVVGR